jgi:uncharacterized protein DUF4012
VEDEHTAIRQRADARVRASARPSPKQSAPADPSPARTARVRAPKRTRARMGKHRLREAVGVAAAALAAGAIVGVAGSLNGLPRVAGAVSGTARVASSELTTGIRALLGSDVSASQEAFGRASSLFAQAEGDLAHSTTLAVRLLASLDPKDRYVAGKKLLVAGQKLSALGPDATALVSLFQKTAPVTTETAAEKNSALTEALIEGRPLLERLATELKDVRKTVSSIPPTGVPEDLRMTLADLRGSLDGLSSVMDGVVGSHDVLLELLGARRDRQYLIVFENNRELRPTGGFIGSFALVDVSQGKVENVHVDSIYNPDGQLPDALIPPRPLMKLTDRWYTRDANWFADFRRSARKIASLFERSGGPTVDGVIAVTPTVLERLLRVTGPIDMPAYDVTVTADTVVDDIQRLVTFDYREPQNPKAFLSDLLPEVLNRVTALPAERWGDLVGVLTESVREKHILVSLRDEAAQDRIERLGWGGTIDAADGDYLTRVEANVGGNKTDDLIDQTVDYDVAVAADGSATATLVVTRHHEGSPDGQPGVVPERDWARMPNVIYERTLVPKGSELLEARGFTSETDVPSPFVSTADYRTYTQDPDLGALEEGSTRHPTGTDIGEEEGKTSFGHWIVTPPGETTVTVYRYRLPFRFDLTSLLSTPFRYELLLQQQPGHLPVQTRATVRLPAGFRVAWAGPADRISHDGEQKTTMSTMLSRDMAWGVVAERQ